MSNPTHKKRILLAVCGGIAAYKAAELVRLLRKRDAEVRVVMTKAAQQFVGPLTFQALSGNPVHSELLDRDEENAMGHINLARWADALVIAPATANMLAKCAHGMADDLVSTLFLAAECPIYVAPAMNQAMWNKSATQANAKLLKQNGVNLIGPNSGDQACGETGYGRMAEPSEICEQLLPLSKPGDLDNVKVLITAGPTREPIDPVRFLSNRSSGKMGYALAKAAREAGAKVILVSGPVNLKAPHDVECIHVETAAEMFSAVMEKVNKCDIFIGAAAVADYRPSAIEPVKIKKQHDKISLDLEKNSDILAAVARLTKPPFSVGFAAETHDLASYAKDKLQRKKLDMIAANWVGREQGGFDSDLNALEVYWPSGHATLTMAGKYQIAQQLIQLIAQHFHEKNRSQNPR